MSSRLSKCKLISEGPLKNSSAASGLAATASYPRIRSGGFKGFDGWLKRMEIDPDIFLCIKSSLATAKF